MSDSSPEVWSTEELSQLNSKISIEERMIVIGEKLKTIQTDYDVGQKQKVLDPIRSYLPSLEQHFKHLSTDDSTVVLESLRCLLSQLQIDSIVPRVDMIDHCLEVADSASRFTILVYVVKIFKRLSSYESTPLQKKHDNYTVVGNILADKNGAARIAIALQKTASSIEDKENDYELVADQLHHWFIFVQRKLVCPVEKKDVAELVEYFTTILLTQKIEYPLGLYIRNILANLLNFQSNSNQAIYVSGLVKYLTEPLADSGKVKQILEILKKLAGRGRCGIIRRSENGAILNHLIRICLSLKDNDSESVIIETSLNLLIMLYESPHYIKEHMTLKTEEFVQFLTRGPPAEKYNDECFKIIRFLMLNDPKNRVLRQNIPCADKPMPLLAALVIKMNEDEKRGNNERDKKKEIEKLFTRHECRIGKSKVSSLLTLGWFALSYLKDTILDLVLAADKIIFRKGHLTLPWLLMSFAIFPLLVCNIVSLKNFYSATPLSVYVSLEGHVPRYRLLKYVFPWRFDSVKHTIFNLLTLFQLHPLITAIDNFFHHVQPIENMLKSQYNIKKLCCIESMLENIPCLAIKIVQITPQIERGQYSWTSIMNIYEIFTIINSVFSLSKSFLQFEIEARYVDNDYYQIRWISQKAVLFLGYFTMISSRMLLFLILVTRFELWVLIVAVSVHMFMTFLTHLFAYHINARKDGNEDEHFVFFRRFDWRLIPFALSEGFLVLLRSPMEYLGVYSSFEYARKRWQFFGIYSLHLAEILIINLCFVFVRLNNTAQRYQPMFIISLVSMGLYIISGLFFAVYFFAVHPKRKETYKFVPENKNLEIHQIEPEHDYDWKEKPCLRVKENFKIDGTKLSCPNDEIEFERLIEETDASQSEPNYIKQRSKFSIYEKSSKIKRDGSRESILD